MKNILIVKLSAIGDVIHALPVAQALKEKFPQAKITWVVEPPAYDLVRDNPCIDHVIVFEKKKFKSIGGFLSNIGKLKRELRREKFDLSLDLQGLFKSAAIAWLGNAKEKLGYCNMREGSDRISRPVIGKYVGGHIVERYLDVARAAGCEEKPAKFPFQITDREREEARSRLKQAGASPENPYVVLPVGANWPNKRWPVKHFARLAEQLYEQGIIPVLAGGGVNDERLAVEIAAGMEIPPIDLVGKTNLRQLAALLAGARAAVGGDTGPMHLAAALEVPAIMLMGPTDANRNGPYGQPDHAIEAGHSCQHCWKRACPYERDCLAKITPESVWEKLAKYC